MFCKKCGKNLYQGNFFCTNCGAKIENESNVLGENRTIQNNQTLSNNDMANNAINQKQGMETYVNQTNSFNSVNTFNQNFNNVDQISQPVNNTVQQISETQKPKKNKMFKTLAIIGTIVAGIIILMVIMFFVFSSKTNTLVCKSDNASITIKYDENGIKKYTSNNFDYDLEDEKLFAQEIGIDKYVKEFNNIFVSKTSGSCTINGKKVSKEAIKENEKETNTNTITVGNEKYGYIDIPNNWYKFYDIDGNTSLQYSYANLYIVSLNYLEDTKYTAKQYASNYMYNKQNSGDVTDITGATVKIGKNKEYTAYQVYMYYPTESVYLITYWFEAEDGKVHYIALEGPGELSNMKLTDYLFIPESFSLKK